MKTSFKSGRVRVSSSKNEVMWHEILFSYWRLIFQVFDKTNLIKFFRKKLIIAKQRNFQHFIAWAVKAISQMKVETDIEICWSRCSATRSKANFGVLGSSTEVLILRERGYRKIDGDLQRRCWIHWKESILRQALQKASVICIKIYFWKAFSKHLLRNVSRCLERGMVSLGSFRSQLITKIHFWSV